MSTQDVSGPEQPKTPQILRTKHSYEVLTGDRVETRFFTLTLKVPADLVFNGQDEIARTSGEAKNPGPNDLALLERGSLRHLGLHGPASSYIEAGARAIARQALREAIRNPADTLENARGAVGAVRDQIGSFFSQSAATPSSTPAPKPAARKAVKVPKLQHVVLPLPESRHAGSSVVDRPVKVSPAVAEKITATRNRAKRNISVAPRASAKVLTSAVAVRTNNVMMTTPNRKSSRIDEERFTVEAYIPTQQSSGVQPFTQWSSFNDPVFGLSKGEGVRLQPADGSLGPVIQAAVANKTHWRLKKLYARWVNTTANTSAGTVLVGMDGSGNLLAPANRAEYVQSCVCIDSNVANGWEAEMPLRDVGAPQRWLKTRRTQYFDGDRADYDAGVVWLATENTDLAVNAQIGRLELTLVIETRCETRLLEIAGLYAPVNIFKLVKPAFSNLSMDLTPNFIACGPDRIGVELKSGAFKLEPGIYRVDWDMYCQFPSGLLQDATLSWSGTALSNNTYDTAATKPGDFVVNNQFTAGWDGQFIVSVLPGLDELHLGFQAATNPTITFNENFTAGTLATHRINRVIFTRIGR